MSCSLGIDLGTTSIKVCVMQGDKILTEGHVHHKANISDRGVGIQDARKIITEAEKLLKDVIKRVKTEFGQNISRIGIAGQQHGLVLWNADALRRGVLDCSELYNWMYPGDPSAPVKLPKSKSNRVFPGYGMRTLCELASYSTFDPEKHWDRCGNIMDYFAYPQVIVFSPDMVCERFANSLPTPHLTLKSIGIVVVTLWITSPVTLLEAMKF
ncbi:unnamed protein product [Strongylus vulgaris]|uniref:Carbohydrate kinase FGGY N-terminal domain-containing protein n=1 Tax=Strongylus vulgaris TaxID=40348 RepID=A0A3P7JV06_STRVU|nr:unnamed protein product [Strongylus vulgaris]